MDPCISLLVYLGSVVKYDACIQVFTTLCVCPCACDCVCVYIIIIGNLQSVFRNSKRFTT